MALSSASAVSPVPAVDNTAKANTSVAASGNGSGGTFTDSLDAVLAPQPSANKPDAGNDNGAQATPFGHGPLAKLKNKLKNGDAAAAVTPQQLQQQQAFIKKLQANNTGIDIPALRGAMGKGGHIPGQKHILPAFNPVTGKAAQTAAPSEPAETLDAAVKTAAGQQETSAALSAADASAPNAGATPQTTTPNTDATPSKGAAHAATQKKLAAALLKAAQAPVLKDGAADGSKVPNTKIAHPGHAHKAAANPIPATDDTDTVAAMAVKIAATAGTSNAPDTAQTAAKSVAVAEVASRKTETAPTVTKVETAALANATQTATHATTPQAKVEAQALPVQFDSASANAKNGDSGAQNDSGDKNQAQPGSARTAGDTPKQADAATPNFVENQPSTSAPAHVNAAPANTATAADAGATVTAPITTAHIATTLHVSPQTQQSAAPDQTAFADLGIAIAARSKDGEKQFDINMHPADLGKIDVRISVDSAGRAQAHLTAEHPQTLQLLKQDQTTLAQNLRDAGLDLANNGLNFSLKGEQQPSTPTFNARNRALSIAAVQTPDIVSTNTNANIAPGDSRLDIRV